MDGFDKDASDIRNRLQAALGTAYVLDRELGGAGMSRVFLATETALGRRVVVKVLPPEVSEGLSAERFGREVRIAAALQHPHVVPLLAAGAANGLLYYTMPYVDGESLGDRLRREGPLPVDEAVRLARETADALHYAHEHGVVHRDVKPGNILLSGGHAAVTDFGIARAVGAAAVAAGGEPLTATGTSLGTPAYMSPEQGAGEPADARSDVYSLGCVLYEMLAGEPPFTGPTAASVIARRFTEAPRPIRTIRPGVPSALEVATLRALERAPADRFATAGDFARAIDAALTGAGDPSRRSRARLAPRVRPTRIAGAVALAFLLVTGGVLTWRRTRDTGAGGSVAGAGAAVTRLVVLPFENLGRPENAYVVDGLTDEIRGKLASVPGMQVIARASSNAYRGSPKTPQEIAGELGVRFLLTGTVRSELDTAGRPTRLRVAPELVEVTEGAAPITRWQQAFDAGTIDVFAMQADIAGRVAAAMDVALGGGVRARLAEAPTRDASAYDAYLRGEAAAAALSVDEPAALRRALGHYAEAVALDPAFAEAWAKRSRAASLLYFNGLPTPALANEARTAGDRALALAPGRPEGHLATGDYFARVVLDYPRALAAYEAGRRLAPSDAELLAGLAYVEQALGRAADAVRDFRAAAALDPRSAVTARRLSVALLWARDYPAARATAERALALAPATAVVVQHRAMVELAQGDLAGARRVLASAPSELDPGALAAVMGIYWDLAWVLDDAGQRRLLALGPAAFDGDRGAWAWVRAQTYGLRGERDPARAYADTARVALEAQLKAAPSDAQRRVVYGLVLATLGRGADGVAEAERGAALAPVTRDAYNGAYVQHQLARAYVLAGRPDRALDTLEPLLRMPYYLSPAWLRIDPAFAPLRGNPRFGRLVESSP